MARNPSGSPLPAAERDRLEARFTLRRIAELEWNPVQGKFDAAHLREVHRRIFQDLPAEGFADVTPGIFRPAVKGEVDWVKTRCLETVGGAFTVAYSRMDRAACQKLDAALAADIPARFSRLDLGGFIEAMADLYADLDYIHPFSDGNSRTLRSFTRQLALRSGYVLDWAHFNKGAQGRDFLCIARDNAVNRLAVPAIRNETTKRKVIFSSDSLAGNPSLAVLLAQVIRPAGQ